MNKRDAEKISHLVLSVLHKKQKEMGISNYKISKACGISESTLSYIKNEKQNPQLSTLILIGNVLGVSLSDVFKEVEQLLKK